MLAMTAMIALLSMIAEVRSKKRVLELQARGKNEQVARSSELTAQSYFYNLLTGLSNYFSSSSIAVISDCAC
jgi:hypothetical protein